MLLTTKGRYAVMAIVDIAQNYINQPIKINEVADRQDISINYLEQIFNKLKKSNIVTSKKGPKGGYILAQEANNIHISDIIKAVEEPVKFTRCNNDSDTCNNQTPSNVKCKTHILWKGLENNITKYLNEITISDICNGKIANKIAI